MDNVDVWNFGQIQGILEEGRYYNIITDIAEADSKIGRNKCVPTHCTQHKIDLCQYALKSFGDTKLTKHCCQSNTHVRIAVGDMKGTWRRCLIHGVQKTENILSL